VADPAAYAFIIISSSISSGLFKVTALAGDTVELGQSAWAQADGSWSMGGMGHRFQ